MLNRKRTVIRARKYGRLFNVAVIAVIIIITSCIIAYAWQKYEEEKYPEGTESNYNLPNAFLDFAQLVTDFFDQDRKENDDLPSVKPPEDEPEEEKITEITVGRDNYDQPSSSSQEEQKEPEEPQIKGGIVEEKEPADESAFEGSVFVGDYFVYYADYIGYCEYASPVFVTGFDLNSLITKKTMRLESENVTMAQYVASLENAKAVYIMLSAESISWMDYSTFAKKYTAFLDLIIAAQPEADIYVQSILPINTEDAAKRGYSVTNEKIDKINAYLASVCEEKAVWYLDMAKEFKDDKGELPKEMTTNGIRLNDDAYAVWYDYILTHKAH